MQAQVRTLFASTFFGAMFSLFALLGQAVPAYATHITLPAVAGLRTPLPKGGYLEYKSSPRFNRFGEEWTGWIDVRHPAMDGTTGTFDPFDRSNRFIQVRTTTLTDSAGNTAAPNRQRDFDFANKVYAQAGVSVISAGDRAYTSGAQPPNPAATFSFPLSHGRGAAQAGLADEELDIRNRLHGTGNIAEAYYARPAAAGGTALVSGANAETYAPAYDGSPGMFFDVNQYQNSTFAHELGHLVLNHGPAEPTDGHSADPQNFLRAGGLNYGFTEIGETAGKMDGAQIDRLFSNPGGAAHSYVQGITENPLFHRYGNHVDWDFVTDHRSLETRANGADSHPTGDTLFWGIGNAVAPNQAGHDHTGLGVFDHPGDFPAGQTFRVADVFSLSARYSDFDRATPGGDINLRETALDYRVLFQRPNGTFEEVQQPSVIFRHGWTPTTNADNYLARWVAPFDAIGVEIADSNVNNHDGITQIDAVVVAPSGKDFGDAPETYKTLLPSGPAYDEGDFQRLGALWDSEPDGQPTVNANGDDHSLRGGLPLAVDDEDGVKFGDFFVDVSFMIDRPDTNLYSLRAWWDLDRNGTFDHPSGWTLGMGPRLELVIDDLLWLPPGLFTRRYPVWFDPKDFYSRFRLTWVDSVVGILGGVSTNTDIRPYGEFFGLDGRSHGEVEDYVPEPSMLSLLGVGAAGLLRARWNRRKAAATART